MDKPSTTSNLRLNDLKAYYPSKKSFPTKLLVSKKTASFLTDGETIKSKDDDDDDKSSDSVVTIDLSDDSIIESNDLHVDEDKSLKVNISDTGKSYKGAGEVDIVNVDSNDQFDVDCGNDSDDSVGTLIATSPVGKKSPGCKIKSTVIKNFNFSDSDDDSFLDIPLSQRLGLKDDKLSSDSKSQPTTSQSAKDDGSSSCDKPGLSWLDDDSLETWTFNQDPIVSSPGKSSPLKSQGKLDSLNESPFKRPTQIAHFKKLEKRPYQSDTPPNKFYTSLKEKASKVSDSSSCEKDDDEMYRIEETITPVRKRRTPEEIAKQKEEKEKRKEEKAEEKRAREKMKAKEKEKKVALREAGKAKLLADCHKFCKTYVDVTLLERFKITDEIQLIFKEKDAQLILETNNPIDCGIHWIREERDMIQDESENGVTVNLIRRETEADIILKVLHPSDYIPFVNSTLSKIELESSDDESDGESHQQTLFEYVTSLLNLYEKNVTLILYGFDKYNSQQKNRENAEYRAKMGLTKRRVNKKNADTLPLVKKCDLDLALFDLQVKLTESSVYSSKRVHIIQTETPTDLCHIIWCHTKATAMCSIKKSQREQQGLEWYAQNDGFGSVDVNTDGDIISLWTKQLMSFTKMSEEMAKSIVEVYPCPQVLLSAYDKCTSETEKETLLSGIEVTRKNYTTGTTSKKLGPQVSRRIYLFMTTRDGDAIID